MSKSETVAHGVEALIAEGIDPGGIVAVRFIWAAADGLCSRSLRVAERLRALGGGHSDGPGAEYPTCLELRARREGDRFPRMRSDVPP